MTSYLTIRQITYWSKNLTSYEHEINHICNHVAMTTDTLNCLWCNDRFATIGTASANSVKSDLGCISRIYFDNRMMTLHNGTLMSQKTCQHYNKCDCSRTKHYNRSYVFSIKYHFSDILLKKYINFIYSAD